MTMKPVVDTSAFPTRRVAERMRDRVAALTLADGRYLPASAAWDRLNARLAEIADGDAVYHEDLRMAGRIAMFRALERGADVPAALASACRVLGIPPLVMERNAP